MTITFFSNFLNDHQLPFCEEIIKNVGVDNFHFVAYTKMDSDRVEMGFEDMNVTKSFVVREYDGGFSREYAKTLLLNSDVAIIGTAPTKLFQERVESGKLTFRYNERLLKQGIIHYFDPRLHRLVYNQFSKFRNNNLFTLCASAYTASDLSLFGFPKSKCFKWGYFPRLQYYDVDTLIDNKKKLKNQRDVSILWVGRLIRYKHPELAITLAKRLNNAGVNFTLNIIGSGELYSEINQMILAENLSCCVKMLGSMPPEKVREHMNNAQIFLFTSDKNEGWGAVLNESMNSACAVVANRAIGSVPFLIKHKSNGLVYNSSNDLYNCVRYLVENPSEIERIGKEAYYTIVGKWNAKEAVKRLLELIESIRTGECNQFSDGPCSLV